MDGLEKIELFETLFRVSAVLAVLGFGLAIFFFFFFRIRDVRAMMTGKAKAETVRQIEERNAMTGKLRVPSMSLSDDLRKTGGKKKVAYPLHTVTEEMKQPTAQVQQEVVQQTTVLQNPEYEAQTTVLRPPEGFRFELTESTMVIHTDEIIV